MAKRWPIRRRTPPKRSVKPSPSEFFLLDRFSVSDIPKWIELKDQILKFHWDYYGNLAYQRSKIADELGKALLEAAQKSFTFSRWQRVVKYKYALEPLSVQGSLVDPGGRFNIGDTNPSQFPSFPALYIASDKDTALQETLSQKIDPAQEQRALDFALANPSSIASVSLSGSLGSVINLGQPERLQPLIDLIKDFSIPNSLKEAARRIGLEEPDLVRTLPKLIDILLEPNWRHWPMQFDVPIASQIFGQLVAKAGIEGILYPSKFTGKDCLVIFPQNFDDVSGSFVQLDDEAPAEAKIRRLDGKVWVELQKTGL